ncbi:hypothetical protein AB4254_13585 [Vibrio breoganii]
MDNIALQKYLLEHHASLVAKSIDVIERLPNFQHPGVYDAGVWFSAVEHITIIYKYLGDGLSECDFEIGLHGKRLQKSLGYKYSRQMDLDELAAELECITERITECIN